MKKISQICQIYWIRGFHGSGYEKCYLLGCVAVQSGRSLLNFRINVLLSFAGSKSKQSVILLVAWLTEDGGSKFLRNGL
jgi:hypothetical protein